MIPKRDLPADFVPQEISRILNAKFFAIENSRCELLRNRKIRSSSFFFSFSNGTVTKGTIQLYVQTTTVCLRLRAGEKNTTLKPDQQTQLLH